MRNRIVRCSRAFAKNLKVAMAWALAVAGTIGCIVGLAALGDWIGGTAGVLVIGAISGVIIAAALTTYINGDCDRED